MNKVSETNNRLSRVSQMAHQVKVLADNSGLLSTQWKERMDSHRGVNVHITKLMH